MNKVCLVLGGGGARGLSFLGVLQVLGEAGVPVDCMVGSSMGAILGAAFCSGVPLPSLVSKAVRLRSTQFFRPSLFCQALSSHRAMWSIVENLVPASNFEDLRVPLTVVCTDLQKGVPVAFSAGPLVPAVVGSSILAGLFEPVVHEGRFLVDGGCTDPVPVRHAPEGCVNLVVDPSNLPDRPLPLTTKRTIRHAVKFNYARQQAFKSIDILIYRLGQERNCGCSGIYVVPDLGDMAFNVMRQ